MVKNCKNWPFQNLTDEWGGLAMHLERVGIRSAVYKVLATDIFGGDLGQIATVTLKANGKLVFDE